MHFSLALCFQAFWCIVMRSNVFSRSPEVRLDNRVGLWNVKALGLSDLLNALLCIRSSCALCTLDGLHFLPIVPRSRNLARALAEVNTFVPYICHRLVKDVFNAFGKELQHGTVLKDVGGKFSHHTQICHTHTGANYVPVGAPLVNLNS